MEYMLDWKSIGSILATFMFLRTALRDFLPPEIYQFVKSLISRFISAVHPQVTILIDEFDASYSNELFDAVQCYLSSRCFASANVLRLSKPKNSRALTFYMDATQRLDDHFSGADLRWSFFSVQRKSGGVLHGYPRSTEHRFFQLSFHRRHKPLVHARYLPHLIDEAAAIRFRNRERRLYTNRSAEDDGRYWSSVPFNHPSTFDTVAIDPALRDEICGDLTKFVGRKDYYARVGRAWKRGYLLYGPPGTGKTSLIAAIANFLEFDIYDLELTAVSSNSQLRKLLISTTSKSVIVVEDVDCTLDLSDRKKDNDHPMGTEEEGGCCADEYGGGGCKKKAGSFSMVSLSGVLNFVDGLWSSCVGERLMIFTTNHVEKLDPALLRPGRMDKRIHLSYCEYPAFKILARNYLGLEGEEEWMGEVEELLTTAKLTPADVAEVFMSCEDDARAGTEMVVAAVKKRALDHSLQSVGQMEINGKVN